MSIKDILVHVDPSPACDQRISFAMSLAHRFGAFLTGVFVLPTLVMPMPPNNSAAAVAISKYLSDLEEGAIATGKEFVSRLRNDGLDGAWHLTRGGAAFSIARYARPVDLVVVGQDDPGFSGVLSTPADVVLTCGLPVLVVPYAGRFDRVGENAVIAWNGSRECARAVHDAIPLLEPQKKVKVICINPAPDDETTRGHLVSHLMRQGFDAGAETHSTKELSPGALLLSRVADIGSDLVVMGAYGHSRLRETVLGGTTRKMLRRMTVPVLMAH